MAKKLVDFLKDASEEDVKKFEAMDEVIADNVKEAMYDDASIKESIKGLEDTITDLKAKFETKNDKEMRKSIEAQLREQLKSYISIVEGVEKIDLKRAINENGKDLRLKLDMKAAGTITTGSILYLNAASDDNAVLPLQENVLRLVSDVTPSSARAITIAEIAAGEGDAAVVAQGAAKPQMDTDYTERTIQAVKIAVWEKFSEETLYDFPAFVSECMRIMLSRVRLKEESTILGGVSLPAYTLSGFKVATPNYFDAIVAAYTQVASASGMSFRPNALILNPVDFSTILSAKTTTGAYLFEEIERRLPNLQIIQSTNVTAGNFVIGDFNYMHIRDWQPAEISVGWVNDDFTKNLVTVVAEERVIYYVKLQDKAAFVADSFSNVITAITPGE